MAAPKTIPTAQNVDRYLNSLPTERRQREGWQILEMIHRITGKEAKMWGPSIIGFGQYHYRYDSGHEGDMALMAFSPRKQKLVFYVLNHFEGQEELLAKLGKHSTGKICLYVNKLPDVDLEVLEEIITRSYQKAVNEFGSSD